MFRFTINLRKNRLKRDDGRLSIRTPLRKRNIPLKNNRFRTLGLTAFGVGTLAYFWNEEDKKRYQETESYHFEEKNRINAANEARSTSADVLTNNEVLRLVEQLPAGKYPDPQKSAYTPIRAQAMVVQGFIGGIITLCNDPDEHAQLVDSTGLALNHQFESLKEKGQRYHVERALAEAALKLPLDDLHQRATELKIDTASYIKRLKKIYRHADDAVKNTNCLINDLDHRIDIHRRLAKNYTTAKAAFAKLRTTDANEFAITTGLPEEMCHNIIEAGVGSAMYGVGFITGQAIAGLRGQVITDSRLEEIFDIAVKLGNHSLSLITLAEKLQNSELTHQEREQLAQQIQDEYKKNNINMRVDEFRLMCISAMNKELSQALAHTIAFTQGPKNLYSNAQRARIFGGATALHPKDILAVQVTSPHCLNDKESDGLDLNQHYEIPSMMRRMMLTMTGGNTPWLVETSSRTIDIYTASQHFKERYDQPCHTYKKDVLK